MGFLMPEQEEASPAPEVAVADESLEADDDSADGVSKEDPYDTEGVTAFLAELRDLHQVASGHEAEFGHADERAKTARLAVASRLMTVKLAPSFVAEVLADLRKHVDQIRQYERLIMDLTVEQGRLPKQHFISTFVGSETDLEWIERVIAANVDDSAARLQGLKDQVTRAQKRLRFLEKRIAMDITSLKDVNRKVVDADSRTRAAKKR